MDREVEIKDIPLLNELVLRHDGSPSNVSPSQLTSQLKKLSSSKTDESHLTTLMQKSIATLEVLELGEKNTPAIYEFIYKYLQSLNVLKINMENLSLENEDDRRLIETLRTHTAVKTLILHTTEDYDFSQVFISKLPNVECLVLNFDMNTGNSNLLMSFIAVTLRNLRVLEIQQLGNSTVMSNIPSLKELKIYRLVSLSTPEWRAITQGCLNIENLIIESIDNPFLFSTQVIEVLCQNLRILKKLFIGHGFLATKEIFDLLSACSSLKNVTIMKKSIEDDPTMIDDFTKTGKQLVLLDSVDSSALRTDFVTWDREDVNRESFEEVERRDFDAFYFDGEDIEFEIDGDDDFYDEYDEDEYDEDENLENEFGNWRPG